MNLASFTSQTKQLFKHLAVSPSKLQLNGSYNSSYWASDIDLYEPVNKASVSKIQKVIRSLPCHKLVDAVLEVKIQQHGKATKVSGEAISTITLPKAMSFCKVDMLITFTSFPIELTIIYDFEPGKLLDTRSVMDQLLEDASDKKNGMYKAIKRLNSVASILGHPHLFNDITERTRFGVMYLSNTRLKLLRDNVTEFSRSEMLKYTDIIAEDLRKYGLTISSPLESLLNKEIKMSLSKAQ